MDQVEFFNTPEYELGKMSTHALLTRFDKPIFLDLYIPSEYETRTLMKILSDKLNGSKITPDKVKCTTYDSAKPLKLEKIKGKFSERIGKGIESAFKHRGINNIEVPYRDEHFVVAELVTQDCFAFGRESHPGYGTLLRYRDNERENWIKKTRDYFNDKENQEFDKIWSIIEPFVGETNKDAIVNY
ncbi:MAG: hypothetical protein ACOCUU_00400 [Nanoarchaeota archaeon]